MNEVPLATLEAVLDNQPYNQEILNLVVTQYVQNKDETSLLHKVNFYLAQIDCPVEIKELLATKCLELGLEQAVLDLLENVKTGSAYLLVTKACIKQSNFSAATEAYAAAIKLDADAFADAELESQLGIDKKELVKSNVVKFNHGNFTVHEGGGQEVNIRFADVGGLSNVKKQINRRIIAPFKKPGIFNRLKRRSGGGILLYGPPGCGKTLLARATAGECNAQFINVLLTDILSKWQGQSEANLHDIFEKARANKPAIIFIDEIEAIASARQYGKSNSTGSSLVSLLLTELDGFSQNNDGVLVLAATNVPWAVDSAFRRPGRFDRQIFVPPPDAEARQVILQGLLNGKPLAADVDVQILAQKTSGYSGADLKNLIETAEDYVIDEVLANDKELLLKQEFFLDALNEIQPSTLEWLATARNLVEYGNEHGGYNEVKEFLSKYARK